MDNLFSRAKHKPLKWHGWIIGIILFIYSSFAVFDYLMSVWQEEKYFRDSGMTDSQIAYFSNFPLWATIAWTISVWGFLFATIGLLLRIRITYILFLISLIGTLANILYTLALSEGREAMGALWLGPIIIAIITTGMVFYSKIYFLKKID